MASPLNNVKSVWLVVQKCGVSHYLHKTRTRVVKSKKTLITQHASAQSVQYLDKLLARTKLGKQLFIQLMLFIEVGIVYIQFGFQMTASLPSLLHYMGSNENQQEMNGNVPFVNFILTLELRREIEINHPLITPLISRSITLVRYTFLLNSVLL